MTDHPQAAVGAARAVLGRAADQRRCLHGPPVPARFSYDRNGLRLGIAALEDKVRELHDEWHAGKKLLDRFEVRAAIRHKALDIAAVALLILEEIPDD